MHQKQSDSNEDWSLFASGLTFLEHFGPWLIELDNFEAELLNEIKALEEFSSSSMMNQEKTDISESAWKFNILQFCAPARFGEFQVWLKRIYRNFSHRLWTQVVNKTNFNQFKV